MKSRVSRNCLRFRAKHYVEPNTETSTVHSSKFQQRFVVVISFNFLSQILNRRRLTVGAAKT